MQTILEAHWILDHLQIPWKKHGYKLIIKRLRLLTLQLDSWPSLGHSTYTVPLHLFMIISRPVTEKTKSHWATSVMNEWLIHIETSLHAFDSPVSSAKVQVTIWQGPWSIQWRVSPSVESVCGRIPAFLSPATMSFLFLILEVDYGASLQAMQGSTVEAKRKNMSSNLRSTWISTLTLSNTAFCPRVGHAPSSSLVCSSKMQTIAMGYQKDMSWNKILATSIRIAMNSEGI